MDERKEAADKLREIIEPWRDSTEVPLMKVVSLIELAIVILEPPVENE